MLRVCEVARAGNKSHTSHVSKAFLQLSDFDEDVQNRLRKEVEARDDLS